MKKVDGEMAIRDDLTAFTIEHVEHTSNDRRSQNVNGVVCGAFSICANTKVHLIPLSLIQATQYKVSQNNSFYSPPTPCSHKRPFYSGA